MQPGRELDALVAEKVMGREVCRNSKGGWSLGPAEYYDDAGESILFNPLPAYSTDIAAAWQVVETVEMCVAVPGAAGSEGCAFSQPTAICFGPRGETIYEWGDTVPHAICLAALKAVGA